MSLKDRLAALFLLLAVAGWLPGCGNAKTFAAADPIKNEVQAELGVGCNVSIRSVNSKTFVNVSLERVPSGSTSEAKQKVLAIVKKQIQDADVKVFAAL